MAESGEEHAAQVCKSVGLSLRKAREAKDIPQRALASQTGISQSTISGVEQAGRDPSLTTIARLAFALGLEVLLVPDTAPTGSR